MKTKLTTAVTKHLELPLTDESRRYAKTWIEQHRPGWSKAATDATFAGVLAVAVKNGDLEPAALVTMQGGTTKHGGGKSMKTKDKKAGTKKPAAGGSVVAGASGGSKAGRIEVKSPFDRFSAKRAEVKQTKHGADITHPVSGGVVEKDSPQDRAKMATWIKYTAMKSGLPVNWTASDDAMLNALFSEEKFCRVTGLNDEQEIDGKQAKRLMGERAFAVKTVRDTSYKALLDDSSSGGIEIAPIMFDDRLITYPVLQGELAPYVEMIDIARGRRIEAGGMANPSVTWGTPEGASIAPFNTSQMVAALDTTIYNLVCAVEVGNDFLADAGVDVGSALIEQIGMKFSEALDYAVALGDGVTMPLGITLETLSTAVNSDTGTSGPPTVSDLENLFFGVPKQYRVAGLNPRLLMNDVTYKRYRQIPVGPTDERRVLGMDIYGGTQPSGGLPMYTLYGMPVSVVPSLSNSTVVSGAMKRYRMYRRLGVQFAWYQEGYNLALRNTRLLVVRARYGGRVIDGNAFAQMNDAQA